MLSQCFFVPYFDLADLVADSLTRPGHVAVNLRRYKLSVIILTYYLARVSDPLFLRIRIRAKIFMRIRGIKGKMIFFYSFFFTFLMILKKN